MKYGVCLNLVEALRKGELADKLAKVAAAGFTYIETTAVTCADMTEEETASILAELKKTGLVCKRACVLFPGTIKVVGPEADPQQIKAYLENLMPKLAALGVSVVVFGSGGARKVPDGFDYDTAFGQFCQCAGIVAEIGQQNGVKVALEHLNPKETNLLTTIEEAVKAARRINHPNCGLLFDFYHVDLETNDLEQVFGAKDILFHSHIAFPGSRLYPMPGDENVIRPYFAMLKKSGYDNTISLEAGLHEDKSFEENLAGAYKLLTALAAE